MNMFITPAEPFEVTGRWTNANAWYMKQFSELAYGKDMDEERVGNVFRSFGLPNIQFFGWGRPGAQAVLAWNDKYAVLLWRGTEIDSWSDIKADLNASPLEVGTGIYVHTGFHEAVESLWSEILHILDLLNVPLFIGGHSLGSSCGLNAAYRLIGTKVKVVAVYQFNGPHAGNQGFADQLITPVYRVVNSADLVSRILDITKYVSVGVLKYIDRNGDLHTNSSCLFRLWDRTLARLQIAWPPHPVSVGVRHHGLSSFRIPLLP